MYISLEQRIINNLINLIKQYEIAKKLDLNRSSRSVLISDARKKVWWKTSQEVEGRKTQHL